MDATLIRLGNTLTGYEKNMGVLANNIANADTAGYKADSMYLMSFDEILEQQIAEGADATKFNEVRSAVRFDQGVVEKTTIPGSIALSGAGFMCVTFNGAEAYTRGGILKVDNNGYLTDAEGNRIVGEGGHINVGDSDYMIDNSGAVYADDTMLGRLKIVDKRNYDSLVKAGGSIFTDSAAGNNIAADCLVMQGYKENSNVDITKEYLNVMTVSRNFETTQRIIQMYDDINGMTAGQIGKLY